MGQKRNSVIIQLSGSPYVFITFFVPVSLESLEAADFKIKYFFFYVHVLLAVADSALAYFLFSGELQFSRTKQGRPLLIDPQGKQPRKDYQFDIFQSHTLDCKNEVDLDMNLSFCKFSRKLILGVTYIKQ